jgi:hypothetical protein
VNKLLLTAQTTGRKEQLDQGLQQGVHSTGRQGVAGLGHCCPQVFVQLGKEFFSGQPGLVFAD